MRDNKTPHQTSTPIYITSLELSFSLDPVCSRFSPLWCLSIMSVTTKATIASFGGKLLKLSHNATTTRCEMSFNLYLPPHSTDKKIPVLIYLSGLTCTADNCSEKGFFQHGAHQKGIAVLYPDTSPRMSSPVHVSRSLNSSLIQAKRF